MEEERRELQGEVGVLQGQLQRAGSKLSEVSGRAEKQSEELEQWRAQAQEAEQKLEVAVSEHRKALEASREKGCKEVDKLQAELATLQEQLECSQRMEAEVQKKAELLRVELLQLKVSPCARTSFDFLGCLWSGSF